MRKPFLDVIASPSSYVPPSVGQSVQWVSERLIVSDLEIAIASLTQSPSFPSLFYLFQPVCVIYEQSGNPPCPNSRRGNFRLPSFLQQHSLRWGAHHRSRFKVSHFSRPQMYKSIECKEVLPSGTKKKIVREGETWMEGWKKVGGHASLLLLVSPLPLLLLLLLVCLLDTPHLSLLPTILYTTDTSPSKYHK